MTFEPMFDDVGVVDLTGIEWIVIGTETGHRKGKSVSKPEWVWNLTHSVRPPEQPKEPEKPREPERPASASLELLGLLEQLQKSPELVNTLTALLSVVPSGK